MSAISLEQEIESLRRHIINCEEVPQHSKAVRVTLDALDNELRRINRDKKLMAKFAAEKTVVQKDNEVKSQLRPEVTVDSSQSAAESLMEWQDVGSSTQTEDMIHHPVHDKKALDTSSPMSRSPFAQTLSEIAICQMSKANVYVSSPIAALAMLFHSVLTSDVIGFKCTGIPDEDHNSDTKLSGRVSKKSFAAPVRELPKGKFVPDDWDNCASHIEQSCHRVSLRYRKDGVGSTILSMSMICDQGTAFAGQIENQEVQVKFGPLREEPKTLRFTLNRHVNLDSFNAGLSNNERGVQPALHYKAAAVLINEFCTVCDVGAAEDPLQKKTVVHDNIERQMQHYPNIMGLRSNKDDVGVGDFAGDMLPPVAFVDPLRSGGIRGGNLMGPNHPAFHRKPYDIDGEMDMSNDLMTPGGLGMRPRFDPICPPNTGLPGSNTGGQRPRRGLNRLRGEPNPDHLKPPSEDSGNMFM